MRIKRIANFVISPAGSELWSEEVASEPSSGCSVRSRPASQTSTDTLTCLDLLPSHLYSLPPHQPLSPPAPLPPTHHPSTPLTETHLHLDTTQSPPPLRFRYPNNYYHQPLSNELSFTYPTLLHHRLPHHSISAQYLPSPHIISASHHPSGSQVIHHAPYSIPSHPHCSASSPSPCSPTELQGGSRSASAVFQPYKPIPSAKSFLQSSLPTRHSRQSHHSRLIKNHPTLYQDTEFNRSSSKTSESTNSSATQFSNSPFSVNLPSIIEGNSSNLAYSSRILPSIPRSNLNTIDQSSALFVLNEEPVPTNPQAPQLSSCVPSPSLGTVQETTTEISFGNLGNTLPSVPPTLGYSTTFSNQYPAGVGHSFILSGSTFYDQCQIPSMASEGAGSSNISSNSSLNHQLDCSTQSSSNQCNCSRSKNISSGEGNDISAACLVHPSSQARGTSTITMSSQQTNAPNRRVRSLRSHPASLTASNQTTDPSTVVAEVSVSSSIDIRSSSPRERSESPTNRIHARHHHHRHHHLNLRSSLQGATGFTSTGSRDLADDSLLSDCEDCDDCDDIGLCGAACNECDLIEHHSSEEELEPLTGSWQRESNGPPEKRKWSQVARLSLTDSGKYIIIRLGIF